ncbi:MAG: metal ABC transporter permease [Pirellulaceae bacterium]|jgi:ABC-type Mn2+/Zn2+ transport system permease subunit|nr:metal ABC transporter permease [Pirellulaceae bacterium]
MSTAVASRQSFAAPQTAWAWNEWWLLASYLAMSLALVVIGLEWVTRPAASGVPRDLAAPLWTIAVGSASAASCAILGCYLVLRRMSLLGDAISHAVLPGIVIAYLLSGQLTGWPIFIGALVLGVVTAALTQGLSSLGRVSEDTSLGIVFTSLFALGVVLIQGWVRHADLDVDCVLQGQIDFAGVTQEFYGWQISRPILALLPTLVVTIGFVALFWKELKIVSFDPALAAAMGVRVAVVHYLLMAMVSVATVASFEAVGSILVVAMLIVPAAAADLLSSRLSMMIAWAMAIGIVSAALGYVLGAALDTSVAGMMAVVAGGQFALAVVFSPRSGLASRWLRNLLLAVRITSEDVIAGLYRAEERDQATGVSIELSGVRGESTRSGIDEHSASPFVRWLASWRIAHLGWTAKDRLGQARLTDAGRTVARKLVRAHRLWETYLDTHFDLPRDHLHDAAERMEHFLDPELQAELDAELAGVATDPHGKQIPPADSAVDSSSLEK